MDVAETDAKYVIIMDLPDVRKSDLNVNTEGGLICISGNRIPPRSEEAYRNHLIFQERGAGKFERCVEIASVVDASSVKAAFADQKLTVEVPKQQKKLNSSSSVSIN